VNTTINTAVGGLQRSARSVQDSAQDIAEQNVTRLQERGVAATSEAEGPDTAANSLAPNAVESKVEPKASVEDALINLKKQELIFTANAKVVETATNTIGSVINDIS